ncbi:MAG: imidazolonepropionase, partial [Candidatus Aminicenantales bacterium]
MASMDGRIVFVGDTSEFQKHIRMDEDGVLIDATGLTGLPGFVDAHTHLPFAGSREEEFVLRLEGAELLGEHLGVIE